MTTKANRLSRVDAFRLMQWMKDHVDYIRKSPTKNVVGTVKDELNLHVSDTVIANLRRELGIQSDYSAVRELAKAARENAVTAKDLTAVADIATKARDDVRELARIVLGMYSELNGVATQSSPDAHTLACIARSN